VGGREQARWAKNNLACRIACRAISRFTIALKPQGVAPGDATSDQMRVMADIGERYALDDIRVAHEQDIVYPHAEAGRRAGGLCGAEGC